MTKYYVELDYRLEDDLNIETGGISHSEYTLEEFLAETDLLDKKETSLLVLKQSHQLDFLILKKSIILLMEIF